MRRFFKIVIFITFLINYSYSKGQIECIEILKMDEIEYYYVYTVLNFSTKDTITILGSKNDEEFDRVKLDQGNLYKIKTRTKSAIKVSEEGYIFCKPAITTIDNIRISDENKLPVLILDYLRVNECSP